MFIHPLNIKVFYFNDLSFNIKRKLIEDRITYIIGHLDKENYSHYRKTIELARNSKTPLLYREFLRKYNFDDISNEISKEEKFYDEKGNELKIIKRDDNYLLKITKDTYLPISIIKGDNFNVYLKNEGAELTTITSINVNAPSKRIAKDIAFSKFIKHSEEYAKQCSIEHIEKID